MIVITGPSGNVGAHLSKLLLAVKPALPLRFAAYDVDELIGICGRDVPCVKFDYDDRTTWEAVLKDVSVLYLLFPLPSPKTARTRMQPFIDAAIEAGCRHMVFISVGTPDNPDYVPHTPVEKYLKVRGVEYTIVRPCFFMQNICRNITTHDYDIAIYNELFIPAGKGITSLVDARDVAAFILEILKAPDQHKNRDYMVTGTEQMDFYQMAGVLSEVTGREIRYINPSLPRFTWRMLRRRIPWDVVAFMCLFYSIIRFGKPEPLTDDLRRIIGREPITLQQFAQDYLAVWKPESHPGRPVVPEWAGGPKQTINQSA